MSAIGVELDREYVKRKKLAGFARAAWHQVEPPVTLVDGKPQRSKPKWSWHLDAICEHLIAVSAGEIQNLLINVPPGCTKTQLTGVYWPSWEWTERPETSFAFTTYAQDLSDRTAKRQRDLIKSDWYQDRWGDVCSISHESTQQVRLFENTRRGHRLSTSVGGAVTGFHASIIVGDDLNKARDARGKAIVDPKAIESAGEYWFQDITTRGNDPANLKKVLIMQRLHERDVAGRCIDRGDYVHLCLPMRFEGERKCMTIIGFEDPRTDEGELLCPERFPEEVVSQLEQDLQPRAAAAQLQQRPVPAGGNIFKSSHWRTWGGADDEWRELPKLGYTMLQSWDCAFKDEADSSFVVGQVWMQFRALMFLLDEVRARMDITATCNAIEKLTERWPDAHKKLIEDKANGPAVVQTLRNRVGGLELITPQGGKIVRAHAAEPYFSSGNVLIPHESIAPWVPEYRAELEGFPVARYNDRVDATTQAVVYMTSGGVSRYLDALRNL